jgi:hypothetical protein
VKVRPCEIHHALIRLTLGNLWGYFHALLTIR